MKGQIKLTPCRDNSCRVCGIDVRADYELHFENYLNQGTVVALCESCVRSLGGLL